MKRKLWPWVFLGLTSVVVGLEVFASTDGNEDTVPWTDYIVAHIPEEVTFAAIGGLSLWLVVHFWRRYRRKGED